MNLIYSTGIFSLIVQFITAIVDFYALTLSIPASFSLLRELLLMELVVQIIESSFYIWMITKFNIIKNITPFRYYDWMITTPTMLITLMFYLMFLRDKEKGVKSESFLTELNNHWKVILKVILLDWAMLFAGYLGEIGIASYLATTVVGFIPFILMFYLIHQNFATQSSQGQKIFWYFSVIWAVYGIAALLPYKVKNAMYNILDLFAKNFFGIFLAYVLYQASTQKG
jgi:bacteriorhodopsin